MNGNGRSEQRPRFLFSRAWLLPFFAFALLLTPRAHAAVEIRHDGDPMEQLKALVNAAPSRQLGQPGNGVVDKLIADRFATAVKAHNDPERWTAAQAALAEVESAERTLADAMLKMQRGTTTSGTMQQTPPLVRYTLEQPVPFFLLLVLVGVAFVATGRTQQRKELIVMGGIAAALAVALLVVAKLVVTEYEKAAASTQQQSGTREGLERAVNEAAATALAADRKAAEALKGLWQSGRVRYDAPAFIPGRHTLSIAGRDIPVHQLTPNFGNPGNLPADGFRGPVVYVGTASSEDLAGKDLRGALAVIEFDSDKRWLDAVQLGAEAVLLLEPHGGQTMFFEQAVRKLSWTPLSIPRFFVTRADLAGSLGPNWREAIDARPTATVRGEPGRWERREVAADWLFIPGTVEPTNGNLTEDVGRQLVHIVAHKDSASLVPALSPGAENAANLVAMLRLLDRFEKQRPQRPVLLAVVNAHGNALQGESEFAHFAFAPSQALWLEAEQRVQEVAMQRFVQEEYRQEPTHARLQELRERVESIAGSKFTVKEPVLDALLAMKNQVRLRIRAESETMFDRVRKKEMTREAMREKLLPLEREREDAVALSMLFNRFGRKVYFDEAAAREQEGVALDGRQRDLLRRVFQEIADKAQVEADRAQRLHDRLTSNLALRRQLRWLSDPQGKGVNGDFAKLFELRHPPLPAIAAFTLDLSFGTERLGFFHAGMLNPQTELLNDAARRVAYLAPHTLKVAEALADASGQPNRLEDTLRMAKGIAWEGHLGGDCALAAQALQQYGVATLTLAGVRDVRPRIFTPHDTVERIQAPRFAAIMGFVDGYLPALIDSTDLGVTLRSGIGKTMASAVEIQLLKQDEFTVKVPKTTVRNGLLFAMGRLQVNKLPQLGEVTYLPMWLTDERGRAVLRGPLWTYVSLLAMGFDRDFRQVNAALDLLQGEKRFISTHDLRRAPLYVQRPLITFDCRKVDLIGLTDSQTLESAQSLQVIDARQDSAPRHLSIAGLGATIVTKLMPLALDGSGSVFLEPHMPFKLRVGNALAINADADDREGNGFPPDQTLLRNLVLVSARDMTALTSERLTSLEDKGVINPTAREFNGAASTELERIHELRSEGGGRILTTAEEARGLAQRAYDRGKSTTDDLIKAVVIFLALVIPFCFFVMKLVVPFTDINRQLASFAAIFVVMTALLFLVHPAFKVAQAPYQVILAFVILGLAAFVASVIFGRFNSAMQQAVEEALQAESADAPQSRLMGAAFMVGVNNMKRRRIRTSLTCATIVLVTFTMLSVLSVGQDVEPARLRISSETPYDGFLFTRPGLGPIDPVQLQRVRAHFENKAITVARAWFQRLDKFGAYLEFQIRNLAKPPAAETDRMTVKALVGLETAEDGLLGRIPLVPGGRWFSANNAREVVLSENAAALIGVTRENFKDAELELENMTVKLVGLAEDEALEKIKDLDRLSILPVLITPSQDAVKQLELLQQATPGSGSQASIFDIPGAYVARAREVAFLPIDLVRLLGPTASYRMLAIKFPPGKGEDGAAAANAAWTGANNFIRFQNARIAVSVTRPVDLGESKRPLPAGQYALISSSTAEITGVLKVAIPTILGATIILNTMLGSVMERRREISIYNAIGLNPTHVMVFFLAESLVYGLVGAVAGYLVGQVLSLIIVNLDLLQLNLNYSSLSVIVVIFLTIGTVLASTIYPAAMAARAAVPSGQRRWSLPQPKGDEIEVKFPFSYDARRVLGACAYLHEFMRQNSEASTGQFLASFRCVGRVPTARVSAEQARLGQAETVGEKPTPKDELAYVMVYDVAPAPFDLGVNQKMEVYAYYDPHVRAHLLAVHLARVSGEKGNWVAVNQPFLEALRKRLLNWRSQRLQTQQVYFEQGQKMFEGAEELPTRGAGKEDALATKAVTV